MASSAVKVSLQSCGSNVKPFNAQLDNILFEIKKDNYPIKTQILL